MINLIAIVNAVLLFSICLTGVLLTSLYVLENRSKKHVTDNKMHNHDPAWFRS